ncbi:hypothetical protein [Youngiibacter multivorans]|uniref:hypothetical protein n=1 Tax=Youngiibacter multivorans TaxID=937251 RepID=UPI001AE587A4|nr:hypothetical protein [Youngiibacter multivorans]
MKYFVYSVLGVIVFLAVLFISTYVGSAMGPGPYDVGFVVISISMLCSIIVVCTMIIVDAIKSNSAK